jgi:hypothetical protein
MDTLQANTEITARRALRKWFSKSYIHSSCKRCRGAVLDEEGIVNEEKASDAAHPMIISRGKKLSSL